MENEKNKKIPYIELKKVTKSYARVKALDEVDINIVDCMSIMRNIFLGREETNFIGKLNFKEMKAITMDLLEKRITIEGIKSPFQEEGELSGGQKQAVAVARAM